LPGVEFVAVVLARRLRIDPDNARNIEFGNAISSLCLDLAAMDRIRLM